MNYNSQNTVLVHDFFAARGGAENVVQGLIEAFPTKKLYAGYSLPDIVSFLGIDKSIIVPSWIDRMPFLRKLMNIYNFFLPLVFERIQFDPNTKLVVSDAHAFSKFIIPNPEAIHMCYVHTPPRFLWNQDTSKKVRDNQFLRFWWNIVVGSYYRVSDYFYARRVNIMVANSEETALRIRKAYRRKAVIVRPPIPVKEISENAKQFENIKREGVLFLNRLEKYKDIDKVIKCWPKDIKLTVAGKGSQEKELRELAKNKPNIEFIIFPSEEEKFKLLATHKAMIYPNKEDFGIVMVEALASGTPVIALKAGGALDIVKDRETGYLVSEVNEEQINSAIKWIDDFKFSDASKELLTNSVVKFDTEAFITKLHSLVEDYAQSNQ